MSKQFSLLATDVDLQELEQVLRDSGEVEFLSNNATEDDRDLQPLESLPIPLPQAGKVSLFCSLVPLGVPHRLFLKRLSPVKIDVDDQRSHLIDFWRPFYNGTIVRRGRVYYQNTMLIDGSFVPKDPEFCRWADRVFARVKRALKYDKGQQAYLGNDAALRIAAGTLATS
jgi:hypothetical protein